MHASLCETPLLLTGLLETGCFPDWWWDESAHSDSGNSFPEGVWELYREKEHNKRALSYSLLAVRKNRSPRNGTVTVS